MNDLDAEDRLIGETLAHLHQPPEPPVDEMWSNIEQRAFPAVRILPMRPNRSVHWHSPAIAAAAALVIGTAIGWSIAPRATVVRATTLPARPPVNASTPERAPSSDLASRVEPGNAGTVASARPLTRAGAGSPAVLTAAARGSADVQDIPGGSDMSRYLYRTSVLLASLPSEHSGSVSDTAIATRASGLLTQTHLLLDSPAGADPTLHRLLEDLELVLAQVARLRARGNGTDLQLIHQALTVHDVLPRVHDATLETSTTD